MTENEKTVLGLVLLFIREGRIKRISQYYFDCETRNNVTTFFAKLSPWGDFQPHFDRKFVGNEDFLEFLNTIFSSAFSELLVSIAELQREIIIKKIDDTTDELQIIYNERNIKDDNLQTCKP